MGLKKVSLGKNKVHLSTETEHWLFKRICEERNQNKDLKRTIDDLKTQIDNQQELLRYLAENLTNKVTSTSMEESSPSGNDSTDEESTSSDRDTEPGRQKNIKKRKLSASSDQSDQDENKSKQ